MTPTAPIAIARRYANSFANSTTSCRSHAAWLVRSSPAMSMVFSLMLLVSIVLTSKVAGEEPWSQFRGPNGKGIIKQCNVPLPWKDSDVKWQIDLPGKGNSSPVLWKKTAYIFSADSSSKQRHLQALDVATGKEVWRKSFGLTDHRLHQKNKYACGTPCVDENGVYLAFADPQRVVLTALSHSGESLWQKDLGSFVSQHGFGGSLVVHQGLVVVWVSQDAEQLPPGQAPGDSRIIAFEAKTGQQKWITSRIATRTCYGTPTLFESESGPALLFANTAEGVFALDLATGKPLWNRQTFTQRSVSSPLIYGDMAIATEGSGAGNNVLFAVNMRGDHELLFSLNRNIPYVPTPVIKDDMAFLWSDKGIVSCLKLPSGEVLWNSRIGGNVSASPIIVGDKLIGITEDGILTVLSATNQFNNLGSVTLGDPTFATPAVTENFLLVRTDSKLLCVGKPE